MKPKTVEEYLRLPYTIEIIRDNSEENPGWTARVVELPGCLTEADTFDELETMLEDAMRSWISTALEDGQPVPEPREDDAYSGKFIVRIPKWLHRQLAEQSDREDISLNQYVGSLLASAANQIATSPSSHIEEGESLRQMIREEVRNAFLEVSLNNDSPFQEVDKSVVLEKSAAGFEARFLEQTKVSDRQRLQNSELYSKTLSGYAN